MDKNGGSGNDALSGGAGNDKLMGGSGDDRLYGLAGNDELKGDSGNDELDGGAGSDGVDGGSGDDLLIYVAAENAGSHDQYDGGSHVDTLRLVLTRAEWMRADVQADIARYLAFIADNVNPSGQAGGKSFTFTAFGLEATKFEKLQVMVDGELLDARDQAVTARADTASVSEDGSVTGNVLANDDVPDLVKSVALVSGPARGSLTLDAGGAFTYTPGASFNDLAVGETATQTFTYRVTDADGDSATASVVITIVGTNDGPVALADTSGADAVSEEGVQPGNTAFGGDATAAGNVLANDSDADTSDVLTIAGVVAGTATGSVSGNVGASVTGLYGSLTLGANGAWTYTLDNTDADTHALAQGEAVTDVFTYTVSDGHGGTATSTLMVNVSGTNDAPQIAAGATTGAVKEDINGTASGQLVVLDPDHNASQSWIVSGGTASANADYHFRADSFTVLRNNTLYFQDDFSDGNPPHNAPNFPNGTAASYGGIGAFAEAGGKLLFDSGNATAFVGAGTPDPIIGQDAILRSNIDPASPNGLKSGANFSIMAVFDLVLPDSPREAYGIRAQDRLVNGPGNPADQPGDDVIELVVTQSIAGALRVALREIDFFNDESVTIQSLALNAPLGADQIRLRLDHSTTDVGALHASFEFLAGGVTLGGSQQTFTQVGRIFGTETPGFTGDDENWTRAALVGRAPATSDSVLSGEYGTLNVNQAGAWTYTLDNSRAVTQNLAEGETDTDTFTLSVSDEHGASDTETVTITVSGTNDAPIVQTGDGLRTLAEDSASPHLSATGLTLFADVDLSDAHTAQASLTSSALSDGSPLPPALAALVAGALGAAVTNPSQGDGHGEVRWDFALANSAVQSLAVNQTLTLVYAVEVADPFGGTATQQVTIRVTGTNDAPEIAVVSAPGAVQEDAVFTATGTLTATDVDQSAAFSWSVQNGGAGLYGNLAVDANGGVTYTLANGAAQVLGQGETFTESFVVRVADEHGATDTQTVTVAVRGANDAPMISASDDAGAVQEAANNSADEIANVTHVDSGSIAFADVDLSDIHDATFTAQGSGYLGTFELLPVDQTGNSVGWQFSVSDAGLDSLAANETRTQSYEVVVDDGHGGTATETVTVTVTGAADNSPPVANDDDLSGGPSTTLVFNYADTGTYIATGYGGFDWVSQGSYYYNFPDLMNSGDAVFNGYAGKTSQIVWLGAGTFDFEGVDIREFSWPAEIVEFAGYRNGMLVESYTVDPDFNYTRLSNAIENIDALHINVLSGPASGNGVTGAGWWLIDNLTYSVHGIPVGEDTSTIVAASELLANDTDPDGDALAISAVSPLSARGATLTLNLDGSVTYAANGALDELAAGEIVTDTFTYTVSDPNGGTDTATVTLSVVGANDGPTAADDAYSTDQGVPLVITGPGVLANDSDVDSPSLSAAAVSGPSHGGLTLNADGSFTYTPFAGYDGTDSFTYSASDGAASSTATVHLTVVDSNDAPLANDDTRTTNEDQGFGAFVPAATDADGTVVGYTLVTSVAQGNFAFGSNGSYSFDPAGAFETLAPGQSAQVSFTYYATDDDGADSAVKTVTIDVNGVNDDPTVEGSIALQSVSINTPYSLTLSPSLFSDVDDGDFVDISVSTTGGGLPGWLSYDAGTLTFSGTPGSTDAGLVQIVVTGTDSFGATASLLVPLTVLDGSTIDGTEADDNYRGTINGDHIRGFGGNDQLFGDPGADLIEGGNGYDYLYGEAGDDVLDGGAQDDYADGGSGNDVLYGGTGYDSLQGGAGNDHLEGGADTDNLNDNGGGSDVLMGGDGNDSLSSSDYFWMVTAAGADTLVGGAGNDYLYRDGNGDGTFGSTLSGGDGDDTLNVGVNDYSMAAATAVADGGTGNDTISINYAYGSSAKHLSVSGGDGADTVYLNNTYVAASVNGGAGNDVLHLTVNSEVSASLGAGADRIVFGSWNGSNAVTVSDFAVAEDKLEMTALLNTLTGWDGSANPFGVGYMELVQDGSDALLRVDRDGVGNSNSYVTLVRLQSFDLAATPLSAQDLIPPYPPDGSAPVGQTIEGDAGNNVLTGTIGGDTLRGFDGDDQLFGAPGADVIEGGNGYDYLYGEAGDDVLDGGAQDDYADGGSGNDVLYGGTGYDSLQGGAGNDHLEGGADTDNLNDNGGGSDVLMGGDGNDSLSSSDYFWMVTAAGADTLVGGAGNDYLYRDGNGDGTFGSTLSGGDGDDTLNVGVNDYSMAAATAVADGGTGNDTISINYAYGSSAKHLSVSGGDGADTVYLNNTYVAASVNGGAGNDVLHLTVNSEVSASLGAGADRIVFGSWNGSNAVTVSDFAVAEDKLEMTALLNTLTGWDGSANPFGVGYMELVQDGSDALLRVDRDGVGNSNSYVTLVRLQSFDLAATPLSAQDLIPPYPPDGSAPVGQTIEGDAGNNVLTGTIGGDTLRGFDGDDQLFGAPGADVIEGGNGYDYLYGEAGDDVLDGGAQDDYADGGSGNDVLYGGTGYDSLQGGAGNDHLEGGADTDNLNDNGGGSDVLMGGDGNDSLSSSDYFWMVTAAGADTLVGGAGNDYLYRDGNGDGTFGSTLSGGDGDDTLNVGVNDYSMAAATAVADGGTGNDTISINYAYGSSAKHLSVSGGDGADTVYLNNTYVAASVNGGAGNDVLHLTVNSEVSASLGAGADRIVFGSWNGSNAVTVSDFAVAEDKLEMTALLNTLTGWDGSSNPFASGHMRLLQDGLDALFQIDRDGGGNSYATMVRMQGIDVLDPTLANFIPAYPPDGSGIFGSAFPGTAADDTLSGTFGDDVISGLAGADTLSGANGNDVLIGGGGADTLTGGFGSDTFLYAADTEGSDSITDFSAGVLGDKLDLSQLLVGYDNDVGSFVQLAASGGSTVVSVDANGGGDSFVALATLQNVAYTGALLADLVADGNLVLM